MQSLFWKFLVATDMDTVSYWIHYSTVVFFLMWLHINLCFLLRILEADGADLSLIKGEPNRFNPLFPRSKAEILGLGLFYFFVVLLLPYSTIAFIKTAT